MFRRALSLLAQNRKPLSLKDALKEKDLLVVDVRNTEEVAAYGKANKAVNIPLNTLPNNLSFFGTDKSRPILFYCAKGVRSRQAADFTQSLGFINSFSTTDAQSAERLLNDANETMSKE